MTTFQSPVTLEHARPAVRRPLLVAAGVGVVLGVVDLLLQLTLPYPLADLANSAAVWAVVALVLARGLGVGELRSAAAGVVALVVAVEAYYLFAIALDKASTGSLASPSTVAWVVMGVVAGAGFGVAGAWSRRGESWWAAAGLGLGVAVLLAEAWQRVDLVGTVLLTAGLGAALLAGTVRGRPVLLGRTVAVAVGLVPVCSLLFRSVGFGG